VPAVPICDDGDAVTVCVPTTHDPLASVYCTDVLNAPGVLMVKTPGNDAPLLGVMSNVREADPPGTMVMAVGCATVHLLVGLVTVTVTGLSRQPIESLLVTVTVYWRRTPIAPACVAGAADSVGAEVVQIATMYWTVALMPDVVMVMS
jgi:hypothetical protein